MFPLCFIIYEEETLRIITRGLLTILYDEVRNFLHSCESNHAVDWCGQQCWQDSRNNCCDK